MCMYVHMYICSHAHVCMWMPGVFFIHSLPYFYKKKISHWACGSLIPSGWLAIEPQEPPVSTTPELELQSYTVLSGFVMCVLGISLRSWGLHDKPFTNWPVSLAPRASSYFLYQSRKGSLAQCRQTPQTPWLGQTQAAGWVEGEREEPRLPFSASEQGQWIWCTG